MIAIGYGKSLTLKSIMHYAFLHEIKIHKQN